MLRTWIAAAALVTAWTGAAAQDVEKGAISFKKCAICHKIGPGATNLVGPVLNGLDGRHSGSVAGFSYSDANKNSGIVWNEETIAQLIAMARSDEQTDEFMAEPHLFLGEALADAEYPLAGHPSSPLLRSLGPLPEAERGPGEGLLVKAV